MYKRQNYNTPVTIGSQTPGLFATGPNAAWTNVYTACTSGDGNNGAQQTLVINVTSLPVGGANYRVYKTTANGNDFLGNAQELSLGENTLNVAGVSFDRTVKFQFSSEDVEFDVLSLNGTSVFSLLPTFVLTNEDGCDSTVTLDLTILNSSTGTDVQEHCDSYTWIDGVTYTESTSVGGATTIDAETPGLFATGPNATWTNVFTACTVGDGNEGAQQTLVINITSLPAGGANYRVFKTTANGGSFNGNATPLSLGENTLNVTGVSFDRTVKFQFDNGDVEFDAISLNGNDSYSSAPTVVLTNEAGCDSTVTLLLTINNSSSSTDVIEACDSYTWIDGVTYTESTDVSVGSEETTIEAQTPGLFTTGPNAAWTNVFTACIIADGNTGEAQTLEINVTSLPAGGANYRVVKTVANGNFNNGNAQPLSLGINTINVNAVSFARTVRFQFSTGDVEFDALSLNGGSVYTPETSSAPTFVFTNEVGCDSTVTLDLTINNSDTVTDVQTACDSYTWIDGNTYTESNNTATFVLENAAGCDSTVTLDLTIEESAEVETSISFTGVGTCGEVEISVYVNGVESGSGAWSTDLIGSGIFAAPADISTTFTTSTFGTQFTLTWTTNDGGACDGEQTSIDAMFEQPQTGLIELDYAMDTESWLWGGLTNDSWMEASNWYKYEDDGAGNEAWIRQTENTPTATDKVYIMANQDAGLCVSDTNSALTVEGSSMTDLVIANNATLNLAATATVSYTHLTLPTTTSV